ncbi:hypothetical protein Dpep_1590 [Dethiosulfovibrio peptidovorans DSM 11002]|uniref:PQ loop repeat protein n=1 Tax=Dethiosulfovibrio peptidovorans DSM 11002 TaxID=469381 RepID=D2Z819_9BACT|nr:hypothetical protein [Dethiosulfovibrio peptidovorans]EFC91616.1 hypothetical protein Dpep_1590 [Dethiosulfovibrio peptidovorans DSM 11002]
MWIKICEGIMLICFGMAWPASIWKSATSKSTKGKSLFFMLIILVGYVAGIVKSLIEPEISWPVLSLYLLNTAMVTADTALYFRNKRLEEGTSTV